jgi:hypothetical protein
MLATVRASPRLGLVRSLRRTVDALAILQRRIRFAGPQAPADAQAPEPAEPVGWTSEPAAKRLLAAGGIRVVRGVELGVDAEPAAGELPGAGPYAVKGVVDGVAHKASHGLVRLGARDADDVAAACAAIGRSVVEHGLAEQLRGFLVEEMVEGIEVMVSLRRSGGLTFLTLAPGGSFVEAFARSASVPLPLHPGSWESLVQRSGLGPGVSPTVRCPGGRTAMAMRCAASAPTTALASSIPSRDPRRPAPTRLIDVEALPGPSSPDELRAGSGHRPRIRIELDEQPTQRAKAINWWCSTTRPALSATRAMDRCWTAMPTSAQRRPAREILVRGWAAAVVSWRHTCPHSGHR